MLGVWWSHLRQPVDERGLFLPSFAIAWLGMVAWQFENDLPLYPWRYRGREVGLRLLLALPLVVIARPARALGVVRVATRAVRLACLRLPLAVVLVAPVARQARALGVVASTTRAVADHLDRHAVNTRKRSRLCVPRAIVRAIRAGLAQTTDERCSPAVVGAPGDSRVSVADLHAVAFVVVAASPHPQRRAVAV